MLCSAVGVCLGYLSSCTSASPSLWFPSHDPLSQVLFKRTSLAPFFFFLSPLCLLTCCLCLPPQAGFHHFVVPVPTLSPWAQGHWQGAATAPEQG